MVPLKAPLNRLAEEGMASGGTNSASHSSVTRLGLRYQLPGFSDPSPTANLVGRLSDGLTIQESNSIQVASRPIANL